MKIFGGNRRENFHLWLRFLHHGHLCLPSNLESACNSFSSLASGPLASIVTSSPSPCSSPAPYREIEFHWGFHLHLLCKEPPELPSWCGLLAKLNLLMGLHSPCVTVLLSEGCAISLALVAEASLMSEFFAWSTPSLWFGSQRSVRMGSMEVGLVLQVSSEIFLLAITMSLCCCRESVLQQAQHCLVLTLMVPCQNGKTKCWIASSKDCTCKQQQIMIISNVQKIILWKYLN